jgi:glycerol kinase
MDGLVLALDQGTTSSRALVFDAAGSVRALAQREFPQILPAPGIVEHDPEAIWDSQHAVLLEALERLPAGDRRLAALGITNQRETTVLWERDTGRPIDHAVVWQSRVSAPICERLKAAGLEPLFRRKTGLLLDPYFSGTKVRHLLDKHPGLRGRAERGEVLFGTIDSYLIWRLTEGRQHVTDVSNASRTLMFDIRSLDWDDELLEALQVPRAMLPAVVSSSGVVDTVRIGGLEVPLAGCAGDQQAALFGQACFRAGEAKNTYGTGCFLLLNTGSQPVFTDSPLLTTVGWRIGDQVTYCLEGGVFVGGAVVQWLRDGLGIIDQSSDVERLAAAVEDTGGVYFVPAFVGLGAPYWDPYARGTIVGLTRGTTAAHLALAAAESMAFQSCDLLGAMQQHAGAALRSLNVDGGASVNDRLMQFQADLLGVRVQRPRVSETTALGAAYLAGLAVGFWQDFDQLRSNWQLGKSFEPRMAEADRQSRIGQWRRAVERSRDWAVPETTS